MPFVPVVTASSCVAVDAARITMRDLASADSRFAVADPRVEVGFTPEVGAKRVLWPQELIHIAQRTEVSIEGPLRPICVQRKGVSLDRNSLVSAIRAWAPPEAEIVVEDFSRFPLPEGELVLPRPTNTSQNILVLRGYVRFDNNRRAPFWVRASLTVRRRVVIVVNGLPRGSVLRPDDVRLEERTFNPLSSPPIESSEDAIGKALKHRVRTGALLLAEDFEEMPDIAVGDSVDVVAREGAALVKCEARAESGGQVGEMIRLRNPASSKTFFARVLGPHSAFASVRVSKGTPQK